jgi:hypothetical protein
MHLLTAEDFRNALISFAVIFAALAGCVLMTTKDFTSVTAFNTLAIIALISVAAAIADLVIKQKRREKGITDKMLMQNVQADVAAGRSPLQHLGKPWVNISVAIIISLVVVSAKFYFDA